MNPELVMPYAQVGKFYFFLYFLKEINKFSILKWDLENKGKYVYCLIAYAQERNEKRFLVLNVKRKTLIKLADIDLNSE